MSFCFLRLHESDSEVSTPDKMVSIDETFSVTLETMKTEKAEVERLLDHLQKENKRLKDVLAKETLSSSIDSMKSMDVEVQGVFDVR